MSVPCHIRANGFFAIGDHLMSTVVISLYEIPAVRSLKTGETRSPLPLALQYYTLASCYFWEYIN